MTLYHTNQICGPLKDVTFRKHPNDARIVFCNIKDGSDTLTMEATHIRALASALDGWEAAQALAQEVAA